MIAAIIASENLVIQTWGESSFTLCRLGFKNRLTRN